MTKQILAFFILLHKRAKPILPPPFRALTQNPYPHPPPSAHTSQVLPPLSNFFKEVSSYKARLETILKFCYKVCSLTHKAAADVVNIGRAAKMSSSEPSSQHSSSSPEVFFRVQNFITKRNYKTNSEGVSITQGFEERCHHPSPPPPSHQ